MKKILVTLVFLGMFLSGFSQIVSETTVKRFSVGADLFTDIWVNVPENMKVRTIQQGFDVFGMYNFPFGTSNFSFAIGLGFGFHDLYSNNIIQDIRADSIQFIKISDTLSYKKSKLGMTYVDMPLEFRLKTKSKFRAAVGFKVGFLVDAKTKYKGDRPEGGFIIDKQKQVKGLEKWRFGPTVRVGWDWISVYAYFSVTKLFQGGRGPELYPISVGITFLPF
jgi:hypothetical protein